VSLKIFLEGVVETVATGVALLEKRAIVYYV